MKTYKINLKLHGSIMTPFHADTLFGHLCWVVAYREGEKGLQAFLEPFQKKEPPFLISDGFPLGLLPKPLSAEFCIDDPQERKELKKTDFISFGEFNSLIRGEKLKLKTYTSPIKSSLTPHNTISRLTNSTLAEGGVYSLKEFFTSEISIYLKTISDEWKNRVLELFDELSKIGYGRKKSIGKGQFSVQAVEGFEFPQIEKADGFITLSNFCPAGDDPTEGLYKTFVKYGKLGEEFTFCGNPFKRPLVMIRAGSVFKANGEPKEFYGRIVQDGIAPAKPEVVHYAYAFPVPIIYPQL
jgi:CRISPR-associated protein Csm4